MKRQDEIKIDSEEALAEHIRDLRKWWHECKYLLIRVRTGRQRTLTQNKALHLFCEMLADDLNAAGLDQRKVMKPEVEIPWTGDAVKQNLWKTLQEAMLGYESTKDADRVEYTQVHEVLSRHMSQKFGLTIPDWPKKKD